MSLRYNIDALKAIAALLAKAKKAKKPTKQMMGVVQMMKDVLAKLGSRTVADFEAWSIKRHS